MLLRKCFSISVVILFTLFSNCPNSYAISPGDGFDSGGFDSEGFNRFGINKFTGTKYSKRGTDIDGYDELGAFHPYAAVHYMLEGIYNINGYNSKGFNLLRIHKDTKTKYNIDGYDVNGFDCNGIHKDTNTQWSPGGFDVEGFNDIGFNVFTSSYRGLDGRFR